MIHPFAGSVFNAPAEVVTNTVNCQGVMGAGLALEFALRHPELELAYQERCSSGNVKIGRPTLHPVAGAPYQAVLNFPTKKHWHHPSRLEWIQAGLAYIARHYDNSTRPIHSLALPRLGCDKGGLAWEDVQDLIHQELRDLPGIEIYLCSDSAPARGTEARMLQALEADRSAGVLPAAVKGAARRALLTNPVPSRFRQLAGIRGVGKETYATLFRHYYGQLLPGQLTIFG
jgi:O-acetyl-ADP-ribose deacetylase (regulator of RNase III)